MHEKTRTKLGGPEDPRRGLEAVVALRRTLEALEAAQAENAFVAGWSWAKIAPVSPTDPVDLWKPPSKRPGCWATTRWATRTSCFGILRADEGIGAEALSSLGVTLEGARDASEGMLSDALFSIGLSLEEVRREAGDASDMSIPDDRKIPYSPRAKNALVGTRKEMRRLGDDHLGTEHVLLGILGDEDGHQDAGPSRRVAGDVGGTAVRIARVGSQIAVGRHTEGGRAP